MTPVRFEKWQALGNDYLILEHGTLDLTPGAVRRLCDPHFGPGADGVLELSPPTEPRLRRPAADLQPRRLRGRAVGQRRARGDPLPAPRRLDERRHASRSRPPPARSGPTITGPTTCRVDMGRAQPALEGLPGRPARRHRARSRAGASSTSRSATRSARSTSPTARPSSSASTWPRSARRSSTPSLFPNRTNVVVLDRARARTPSAPASSSAAWGRRSPPAPARAARPSPTSCAAATRRSPSSSTAASWRSTSTRRCTSTSPAGPCPVYRGELSEELLAELASTAR